MARSMREPTRLPLRLCLALGTRLPTRECSLLPALLILGEKVGKSPISAGSPDSRAIFLMSLSCCSEGSTGLTREVELSRLTSQPCPRASLVSLAIVRPARCSQSLLLSLVWWRWSGMRRGSGAVCLRVWCRLCSNCPTGSAKDTPGWRVLVLFAFGISPASLISSLSEMK